MQDCVADDTKCQGDLAEVQSSFNLARAALLSCLDFIGGDSAAEGVLGAAAASLVAVELARVWWRRWHPEGPDFPPDR